MLEVEVIDSSESEDEVLDEEEEVHEERPVDLRAARPVDESPILRAGCKRNFSAAELDDVCAESQRMFPSVFAKAIKVMIFQAQLLRGFARAAVHSEIRSMLDCAWEQREARKHNSKISSLSEEEAKPSEEQCKTEDEQEEQEEQITTFAMKERAEEDEAPAVLDELLAPSCNSCGWLAGSCQCETSTPRAESEAHACHKRCKVA